MNNQTTQPLDLREVLNKRLEFSRIIINHDQQKPAKLLAVAIAGGLLLRSILDLCVLQLGFILRTCLLSTIKKQWAIL